MVRITAGGVEVSTFSGQSKRFHVLAPGSSVSAGAPTDLAYESGVSIVVDGRAYLDIAGHETGLRFRLLLVKMCVLVYTDTRPFTVPMSTPMVGEGQAGCPCPFSA